MAMWAGGGASGGGGGRCSEDGLGATKVFNGKNRRKYIFFGLWVYLHLPAKWLGGRKPLGWGAGP